MATTHDIASQVRSGDEVLMSAFARPALAEAVREAGGLPVFVDIDPATLSLAPTAVGAAITERTVAVAAEASLMGTSDRGALRAADLREVPFYELLGDAPTLSEFELAALRRHTTYLSARLRGVITTGFTGEAAPGLLAYVVRVPGNGRPDRDAFKRALRARGVQCEVPVQTPLHWTRAFHTAQSLPETERASAECLSLLLRPRMTKRELQKIVSGCNALGGLLMEPAC